MELFGVLLGIAVALLFSWTSQVATTSITAVLASNYSVISILVGLIAFRERLTLTQIIGICLILGGIKPTDAQYSII